MRVFASCMSYALFAGFGLAELLTATPAVADPTITAAPVVPMELFRKQNDARFMGWVLASGGSYTSRACETGGTYYQSGSVWRCCATTAAGCNVPLGCFSGNLVYSRTTSGTQTSSLTTIPCTAAYGSSETTFSICNTGFLYENTVDANALTNVFCGISSINISYYRVKPDVTSSASSSSSTSASTPQSTSASTTGTGTSGLSTSSPGPEPEQTSSSKAWIAGAVVGPVLGLALLGAIIFFCMRRKKKNNTAAQPPMSSQQANGAAPNYPNSPNPAPAYYDNQQKQNTVPFGVASQGNWAPQSPTSQGSVSPNPQHSSPYAPPGTQQQQWQNMPQQGQQMYPPPMTGSPPPQHLGHDGQAYNQPGAGERPFSAELYGGGLQNISEVDAAPEEHHQR